MWYYRAISEKELKKFLELNNLNSKEDVIEGAGYIINIPKDTLWVNREGYVLTKLSAMAKEGKGYCGIILRFWSWNKPKRFNKNLDPKNKGKLHCNKEHVRTVKVYKIYPR